MAINLRNGTTGDLGELTRRKLEAFARIEEDFIASFGFVQEVHGRHRFTAFPVAGTVRYLHSLYICECKDRLLSIPRSMQRYEGVRCLVLLRDWQEGHTAGVVSFIHRKLDDQPFGELTQRLEEAAHVGDIPRVRRLTSGRAVLLNRNFTLSHALDAIFALEPEQLREEARVACERYGHTTAEIDRQLAELQSDLYAYAPSAALAQRNMYLMNHLGMRIMDTAGDRPGERTDHVRPPALPAAPYAEEAIPSEMTQISLRWNSQPRVDITRPLAPETPTQP